MVAPINGDGVGNERRLGLNNRFLLLLLLLLLRCGCCCCLWRLLLIHVFLSNGNAFNVPPPYFLSIIFLKLVDATMSVAVVAVLRAATAPPPPPPTITMET
uniref:Uncharacterized protein n=1 Tax=Panstrongylus lignarius TaxID=156445 RepID=A0A224Y1E3_9HEMI